MLAITCRFTQQAALVLQMDVSCITTQQIVYKPVDVPSSVSISGSKSVSWWLSWAHASNVLNSPQAGVVCEFVYPAGKLTLSECWALSLLPGGTGGVQGICGIRAALEFRAEVAFQSDVASALDSARCIGRVDVHLFLCVSSVCADFSRCHCGKRGECLCGFHEAWPRIFPSQPSPLYALETHPPTSSLLGLRRELSWPDIAFLILQNAKTRLWPFGHNQGNVHVGLFQLFLTSLPCHSRRHVENQQESSCCSKNEIRLVPRPYMLP